MDSVVASGRLDRRRDRWKPVIAVGGVVARIVVLACVVAIAWALYTAWSSGGSASRASLDAAAARGSGPAATAVTENDGASLLSAPSHREHVVSAGETLWGLATAIAADEDPRAVVHEISVLNGLRTASISAGDVIVLPVR
ncbi:MAG: LysM peptidoglycan-binding domain-containing protein [Actinobacteria bacterium]|nr:LysM peptidoglycan-binding domain-containing protein [Actinomycetota bacterium]